MATNEQTAVEIEAKIMATKAELRGEVHQFLALLRRGEPIDVRQGAFFNLHGKALDFFNLCEQSVADSGLLGAHRNERWVRNKAETCKEALGSILEMHRAWQAVSPDLAIEIETFRPGESAYASLQRIVADFFPESVAELRADFHALGLPVSGFPAMNEAETLLAEWAPYLEDLETALASSPMGMVKPKDWQAQIASLVSHGARIIATNASWLSSQWEACDHRRRPARDSLESAGLFIGEVPLATLADEVRERLAILRVVVGEVHRKIIRTKHRDVVHLLLAWANPDRRAPLAVDSEAKRIHAVRIASPNREKVRIESLPDADLKTFSDSLRLLHPRVLHFSGHGGRDGSLLMRDHNGKKAAMHPDGVSQLIRLDRGDLRLVVLNACHSQELARLLVQGIGCVVGMTDAVSDGAAIVFAQTFYGDLFDGEPVGRAFDRSRAMVTAQFHEESDVPLLTCRADVDPANVRIVD